MGIFGVGVFRVGVFLVGVFLGGSFPGGEFSVGGSFPWGGVFNEHGWEFSGGEFSGFRLLHRYLKMFFFVFSKFNFFFK